VLLCVSIERERERERERMLGKGDSEADDEDDWLSDRVLRKRRYEEEKSNEEVVVYDFESDSFAPTDISKEEMNFCETCLYEPTTMCQTGRWGALVAAIIMDLVAGTPLSLSLISRANPHTSRNDDTRRYRICNLSVHRSFQGSS